LPHIAAKSKFERRGKGKSGIRDWQTGGRSYGVFFNRNNGIIAAVRKWDVIRFQGITRIFEFGCVAVRTGEAGAGKNQGRTKIRGDDKGSREIRRPSFLRASEM
jgi:hypothetical protein